MTSAFCLFVFETFVSRLLALFGTIITSESGNPTRPGDKWERKLLVFGIFYSFLTSGRPLSSSTESLHCEKHNGQLILIFSHKFLVKKGTLFPVGNKTWQYKTNQLEYMIHSILLNYCWSCCYSTLTSSLTDMQCNCMMGLFPEIRRAWLTIDSDIFVWNYEDG